MLKGMVFPFGVLITLVATCASHPAEFGLGTPDRRLDESAGLPPGRSPVADPAPTPAPRPTPTCQLFQKDGVVLRSELNKVINAGLGRWLGEVEGDRAILKGRFQGWIVKRLHPRDPCYQKIAIQPGDIVVRINQQRIEKPEQAFAVFESLRKATELRVDYLHQGEEASLQVVIVDD